MKKNFKKLKVKNFRGKALTVALVLLMATPLLAAGGSGAISAAAGIIKGYVTDIGKLIYAVAAVVGTVGGIRIYNKWTNGDQDINKEIVGWGGACVFLLLVPTFITAMFP